jgi:hypothetical protein
MGMAGVLIGFLICIVFAWAWLCEWYNKGLPQPAHEKRPWKPLSALPYDEAPQPVFHPIGQEPEERQEWGRPHGRSRHAC